MEKNEIIEELKNSVYWNECEGNAGYKLISVSNVERLIETAIDLVKEE